MKKIDNMIIINGDLHTGEKLIIYIDWNYYGQDYTLACPIYKDDDDHLSFPLKLNLTLGFIDCFVEMETNQLIKDHIEKCTDINISIIDIELEEAYRHRTPFKYFLLKDDKESEDIAIILSDDWYLCHKVMKSKKEFEDNVKFYDENSKILYCNYAIDLS